MSPRQDRWIAAALWAFTFAALWATESAVGFVRDESVYFAAAERYASWFQLLVRAPANAMRDSTIVRFFDVNHEHPALMKILFGLSHLLFHEALGVLRPATAFRLPAFALSALIPPLVYRMGTSLYGRTAGLFAALSFFLVPRQYFNAQLACFDMPIAALWLLVVYAFWRSRDDLRWGAGCGLAFGAALATKHNALFLPFALVPFAAYRGWLASRSSLKARGLFHRCLALFAAVGCGYGVIALVLGPSRFERSFELLSPQTFLFLALAVGSGVLLRRLLRVSPETARAAMPVAAMAVLGPAIFYLHWPYLWHAPVERTAWYLAFHATHNHYAWFYLGELLREPPFPLAYVVVVTGLTVPASLFAPMVTGYLSVLGRGALALVPKLRARVASPSCDEWLLLVQATASIAIISHPQVPHFGGVKHWLPSMPFLALFAGLAVARGCEALGKKTRLPRPALAASIFTLLFLPALVGLARVHPYGTSYYSELAGGLPGAASLGMQRQFWSNNVTGVLPWINAHAPRGARLYLHEVNGLSFRDYQRNGMLRADLVSSGPFVADVAAYQYHQEFREHEVSLWQAFETLRPVAGLYLDETPQVVVYLRRGLR